jgi:hypothetical protein
VVYALTVAVACWAVAVYGMARLIAMHRRMSRDRTVFPVAGIRVASTRVTARLAHLPGRSGNYRGLLWARTADGVACRGAGHAYSVIAECRQEGDEVVVDAVLPHSVRLMYLGMIGFMVVASTVVLSVDAPRDWSMAIPLGLLGAVTVQYVWHVRRARTHGRLLPRYVEAACAEAAACARHENPMKIS